MTDDYDRKIERLVKAVQRVLDSSEARALNPSDREELEQAWLDV